MLDVVQHRGFYHLVEPVAVIKLNCLNKAFACQAVEWQNERVTHFKDQGERELKNHTYVTSYLIYWLTEQLAAWAFTKQ